MTKSAPAAIAAKAACLAAAMSLSLPVNVSETTMPGLAAMAPALKALKVNGFLDAADDDFGLVRDGMKRAEDFVRNKTQPAQPKPDKD